MAGVQSVGCDRKSIDGTFCHLLVVTDYCLKFVPGELTLERPIWNPAMGCGQPFAFLFVKISVVVGGFIWYLPSCLLLQSSNQPLELFRTSEWKPVLT
jgi:hypothetical protein